MSCAVAQHNLWAIGNALENYAADHAGAYPADIDALLDDGPGQGNGREAYFSWPKLCLDPWRHPYLYERRTDGHGWRLSSLGSDGEPGGCGDARDLRMESN